MVAKKLKTQFWSTFQQPKMVVALMLALASSGVSLVAAAYGGWGRGVETPQKFLMASIACIVVFGDHLLPALLDRTRKALSLLIVLMWLACSVFLVYSHTQMFLLAQQGVGEVRVNEKVEANHISVQQPDRKLSTVLAEKAKSQAYLTALNACQASCERYQGRRELLKGQLEALAAEEREWVLWEQAATSAELAKQKVAQDQALTQASLFFNVRYESLVLLAGVLFSVILEGVGALCWYCLLNDSKVSVTPNTAAEVRSPMSGTRDSVSASVEDVSNMQRAVDEVRAGIHAGEVFCTVKSIRSYLGCAQEKASQVRRILAGEVALQAG
jgi:hypothetical protein